MTLPTCAAWAGTQRATGVPAAVGDVAAQRTSFYADGGGIKSVGTKYYAAWFPSTWASSSTRRVMVDLHGTGGAPETEWSTDWKAIFTTKNWAWIGLKYVDDSNGSYDADPTIYTNLKTIMTELAAACDFGSPLMFLQGYSRGSANTFPIAYLDIKDRKYFKAMVSNSGAWSYPNGPLVATMQGVVDRKETTGYSGTKFWLYCGERDFEHGYKMCLEMNQAKTWVTSYGGTVERLYQDPTGAHGGLAKNSDAISGLFSYLESLR